MAIAAASPVKAERDELSEWANFNYKGKWAHPGEEWPDSARRVATHVMGALGFGPGSDEVYSAYDVIRNRLFIPGGRYMYGAGRELHQINNCFLLRAEDTREGWGKLADHTATIFMTGGGAGVQYSALREEGAVLKRAGGVASGPVPLMCAVNEWGRAAQSGGHRRAAIWAGLNWSHPDALKMIAKKDWSPEIRELKSKDFNFPAPLDMTNISICLDDEFFVAYEHDWHPKHALAHEVYDAAIDGMLLRGEPGFSVDVGPNSGEDLRNPCTEITSRDDSDVCNLGSMNLARVDESNIDYVLEVGTLFLLAGTVYSDVPYDKVADVREQNRRLGYGIMGVHEWLLQRGHNYGMCDDLDGFLTRWESTTDIARRYADEHSLSPPVKTRDIAPTGTGAMVGETTGGMEAIFARAKKRRTRDAMPGASDITHYQYVVDPTARRAVEEYGWHPDEVEDSYILASQPERRVAFQAALQRHVDHGISSTINLPGPVHDEEERQQFGRMLYRYLPQVRGITCYPDGVIAGQPETPVPLEEAMSQQGVVYQEVGDNCKGGVCSL